MTLKRGKTFADIIETYPIHEVWEIELSRLISEHYGREYRLANAQEMENDTYLRVEVGPHMSAVMAEMDQGKIELEQWQMGATDYIDYNVLLWHLNLSGLIPTGEYLIRVCW